MPPGGPGGGLAGCTACWWSPHAARNSLMPALDELEHTAVQDSCTAYLRTCCSHACMLPVLALVSYATRILSHHRPPPLTDQSIWPLPAPAAATPRPEQRGRQAAAAAAPHRPPAARGAALVPPVPRHRPGLCALHPAVLAVPGRPGGPPPAAAAAQGSCCWGGGRCRRCARQRAR